MMIRLWRPCELVMSAMGGKQTSLNWREARGRWYSTNSNRRGQ